MSDFKLPPISPEPSKFVATPLSALSALDRRVAKQPPKMSFEPLSLSDRFWLTSVGRKLHRWLSSEVEATAWETVRGWRPEVIQGGVSQTHHLSQAFMEAAYTAHALERRHEALERVLNGLKKELKKLQKLETDSVPLSQETKAKIATLKSALAADETEVVQKQARLRTELAQLQRALLQEMQQTHEKHKNMLAFHQVLTGPRGQVQELGLVTAADWLKQAQQEERARHEQALAKLASQIEALGEQAGTEELLGRLAELHQQAQALTQSRKQAVAGRRPAVLQEIAQRHAEQLTQLQGQLRGLHAVLEKLQAEAIPGLAQEREKILGDIVKLEQVLQRLQDQPLSVENFDREWNRTIEEARALRVFAKKIGVTLTDFKARQVAGRAWPWNQERPLTEAEAERLVSYVGRQGVKLTFLMQESLQREIAKNSRKLPSLLLEEGFLATLLKSLGRFSAHVPQDPDKAAAFIAGLSAGRREELLNQAEQTLRNQIYTQLLEQRPSPLKAGDHALVQVDATAQNLAKFIQTLRQRLSSAPQLKSVQRELNFLQQMSRLRSDPRIFQAALTHALLGERSAEMQAAQRNFSRQVQAVEAEHAASLEQLKALEGSVSRLMRGETPTESACRQAAAGHLAKLPDSQIAELVVHPEARAAETVKQKDFPVLSASQKAAAVDAAVQDVVEAQRSTAQAVLQHSGVLMPDRAEQQSAIPHYTQQVAAEAHKLAQEVNRHLPQAQVTERTMHTPAEQIVLDRAALTARALPPPLVLAQVEAERAQAVMQTLQERHAPAEILVAVERDMPTRREQLARELLAKAAQAQDTDLLISYGLKEQMREQFPEADFKSAPVAPALARAVQAVKAALLKPKMQPIWETEELQTLLKALNQSKDPTVEQQQQFGRAISTALDALRDQYGEFFPELFKQSRLTLSASMPAPKERIVQVDRLDGSVEKVRQFFEANLTKALKGKELSGNSAEAQKFRHRLAQWLLEPKVLKRLAAQFKQQAAQLPAAAEDESAEAQNVRAGLEEVGKMAPAQVELALRQACAKIAATDPVFQAEVAQQHAFHGMRTETLKSKYGSQVTPQKVREEAEALVELINPDLPAEKRITLSQIQGEAERLALAPFYYAERGLDPQTIARLLRRESNHIVRRLLEKNKLEREVIARVMDLYVEPVAENPAFAERIRDLTQLIQLFTVQSIDAAAVREQAEHLATYEASLQKQKLNEAQFGALMQREVAHSVMALLRAQQLPASQLQRAEAHFAQAISAPKKESIEHALPAIEEDQQTAIWEELSAHQDRLSPVAQLEPAALEAFAAWVFAQAKAGRVPSWQEVETELSRVHQASFKQDPSKQDPSESTKAAAYKLVSSLVARAMPLLAKASPLAESEGALPADLPKAQTQLWKACAMRFKQELLSQARGALDAESVEVIEQRAFISELLFNPTVMAEVVKELRVRFAALSEEQLRAAVRTGALAAIQTAPRFRKEIDCQQAARDQALLPDKAAAAVTAQAEELAQEANQWLSQPLDPQQAMEEARRLVAYRQYYQAQPLEKSVLFALVDRESTNAVLHLLQQQGADSNTLERASRHYALQSEGGLQGQLIDELQADAALFSGSAARKFQTSAQAAALERLGDWIFEHAKAKTQPKHEEIMARLKQLHQEAFQALPSAETLQAAGGRVITLALRYARLLETGGFSARVDAKGAAETPSVKPSALAEPSSPPSPLSAEYLTPPSSLPRAKSFPAPVPFSEQPKEPPKAPLKAEPPLPPTSEAAPLVAEAQAATPAELQRRSLIEGLLTQELLKYRLPQEALHLIDTAMIERLLKATAGKGEDAVKKQAQQEIKTAVVGYVQAHAEAVIAHRLKLAAEQMRVDIQTKPAQAAIKKAAQAVYKQLRPIAPAPKAKASKAEAPASLIDFGWILELFTALFGNRSKEKELFQQAMQGVVTDLQKDFPEVFPKKM